MWSYICNYCNTKNSLMENDSDSNFKCKSCNASRYNYLYESERLAWDCPSCNHENRMVSVACRKCKKSRPKSYMEEKVSKNLWVYICTRCGHHNKFHNLKEKRCNQCCGKLNSYITKWICIHDGYYEVKNPANDIRCYCGKKRPDRPIVKWKKIFFRIYDVILITLLILGTLSLFMFAMHIAIPIFQICFCVFMIRVVLMSFMSSYS